MTFFVSALLLFSQFVEKMRCGTAFENSWTIFTKNTIIKA